MITCSGPSNQEAEEEQESTSDKAEMSVQGFYIGTYTNGESEGIYHARFDPADGSFSSLRLSAEAADPSFLTLSSDGDFLYSVDESLSENNQSSLVAYRVNSPGDLSPLDTISSGGTYACYITTDQAGRFVLAANYGSGNVISAAISVDGGFTDEFNLKAHFGTGPVGDRQEGPHAHCIVLDPNGRFALSADLGADKIMVYEVGPAGELVENSPAFTEAAPGAGPRHIAFHPNGKWLYVINELNSTITWYEYNQNAGILSERQTITTLPADFSGDNKCADIHVHPSGKYLYGSNRGHDSIVAYQIGEDGELTLGGHFTEEVIWPRNFAVAPGGQYLIIANEQGNSIISASIDENSGMPTFTGNKLEVANPVCIKFE